MKKLLLPLLLCVLMLLPLAMHAAAEETFVNPVVNGADPFVFKDTDGTYYLYVTSGGSYGYRVHTSKNLVEWEARGYCLRRSDVYTDDSIVSESSGNKIYNFWAPEVIKEGDTYYMVYTAQEHIGIATSDSPLGPFTNKADSFLLPDFKNIDGHFFRDDDGKIYLYFVSCGAVEYNGYSTTKGNNIWGGEFDLATCTFVTDPVLLVEYDTSLTYILSGYYFDGSPVAEGPEILKHNGKYYLTYSASGYKDPKYAVHYATSDSPLGSYTKYSKNPIFITDDRNQTDTKNPHLYGTAHHCFTTSPDGTETIIVYHAHRTGDFANCGDDGVEERRICIDLAWFDESGVLHAGRNKDGVPSATAQALPSGGSLTRKTHFDGVFAEIPNLPTVYVSAKDGLDTNAGTKAAPFKTLDAAYAALPNGGTIVLTQTYTVSAYETPVVNGPICITGEFTVPFIFKFLSVNSDTYFDNIAFWPNTSTNISIIEGNYSNLVMGEGVSCIAQPTRVHFPYLIGGQWRYTGSSSDAGYANHKHVSDAALKSDKAYTLTVYNGTWTLVTKDSLRDTTLLADYSPNASVILFDDALVRPAKPEAPIATASGRGAKIAVTPVEYATKYIVYKNGVKLGYTTDNTFLDTTFVPGVATSYAVAPYAHGACIGDVSAAVTLTGYGDQDGDGDITVEDAISLLRQLLGGNTAIRLLDVLVLLLYSVR